MPDPMWRQIAEDLRRKIDSGDLGRDGAALPSELELRERYSASRNTVRDAVKWLVTRGLVVTRPGQGTFVAKRIDPFVTTLTNEIGAATLGGERAAMMSESIAYHDEVTARSRTPEESIPRVEILRATGLVADELGLAEKTSVVSRHQERLLDGTPWSLQTTFYPMRLVDQGATRLIRAENLQPGVVAYIEDTLGVKQVGWRDKFTVRAPDIVESTFFNLPDDGRVAVIQTIRTGYDESGSPFRVTITTYPADRNQFVMTVGQVPPVTTVMTRHEVPDEDIQNE
jgi:GntR family transcriptional regulator